MSVVIMLVFMMMEHLTIILLVIMMMFMMEHLTIMLVVVIREDINEKKRFLSGIARIT